jgi:hypothetical protein
VGAFNGYVKAEWLEDGVSMRLLCDFEYVEDDGYRWVATAGTVVNGASIPRPLWSIIGSPFTGRYRAPSVLHDALYQDPNGHSRMDIDRMFRRACRDCGVGVVEAGILYLGIRLGGGFAYRG